MDSINQVRVNATHSSTSVENIKARERVRLLQNVHWYIKADLANGFRQFGTHPRDWIYQVYCNGANEHYIDLACPFGKTNSPLEFCAPVALFAKSVSARYSIDRRCSAPKLATYVDDIIRGFENNKSLAQALDFRP